LRPKFNYGELVSGGKRPVAIGQIIGIINVYKDDIGLTYYDHMIKKGEFHKYTFTGFAYDVKDVRTSHVIRISERTTKKSKMINVLSLFDGYSGAAIALDKLAVKSNYYASEIEPYALKISAKNFPGIKQMGSVTELKASQLPKIDLMIGGSPCQSFSNANQFSRDGFDGKSGLFWEYVRLLNEVSPTYFVLENVKMKKEWRDVISKAVGVDPIEINSALLSAQNRARLYWTNIPNIQQPKDAGILLRDVLETNPGQRYNLSQQGFDYMSRLRGNKPRWEYHKNPLDGKAGCLTASMRKGVPYGVIRELNRRLTPLECERLQTLPDNYTQGVADTHRFNMIGNGFTADVIAWILSHAF
jgi:site-specific DNA-cytosine methylase